MSSPKTIPNGTYSPGAVEMTKEDTWKEIENKNLDKFLNITKEQFFEESEDWHRRNIPKDAEKQIQKDVLAYCEYITNVLSLKNKHDLAEAIRLHQNVLRWKPENFPLKTDSCQRDDEP